MNGQEWKNEFFARAFLENRDREIIERIGLGMKAAAEHQEILFSEKSMLPGVETFARDSSFGYVFSDGVAEDPDRRQAILAAYPEQEAELREIRAAMEPFVTQRQVMEAMTPRDLRLSELKACWGGEWGGHGNPDYGRLLHLGTNGIRALIEACRAENPGKDGFYNACADAMDALDILGRRARETALARAQAEGDPGKKAEWLRIAGDFLHIPMEPAWDMHSATQLLWLFFTQDGRDSPGRYDQFMIDFYRAGSAAEGEEMVRRFLEAMHEVRGWNVCLSGSDENGNDESNELTYVMLEQVKRMGYQTPNLTLRVHRGTPEAVWKAAADCLGTGIGLPAVYNDEVVCAALEKIGIPPRDSHDYCMNGCNQIDIMGKSHMGLEDGEVNLGKALEYALHNGYDYSTGGVRIVAGPYGDPRDCASFGDFLALYYRYLDELTDAAVRMANAAQARRAVFGPNPLRSCLHEGCLEKGRDYRNGGPLYGHGQILAEGIADTADSLHAVRRLVYREKKYTMDELVRALETDFEGRETLRRDLMNCEKFGNDIEDVDTLCAAVTDHFFAFLKTRRTFRGGVYTGGCSPFSRAASNGMHTAALPNGRRSGESRYADSIAATPGNDVHGPTAAVRSMLRYSQTEACSGFVTQMKFDKTLFNSGSGRAAFIALAKTYFAHGGQQLSVNVLDRAALLEAQKHPERYRNLIVRVGGYSDYFCNLTPELQQNVIDRSEFAPGQ